MSNGGMNSISPDFICGDNFKIGSFCVIEEDVVVGDNVHVGDNFKIGSFCVIEEDVVVGDNVHVGNLVVIKKGQRIPDGMVCLDQTLWI